jgi:hypothetical protein
VFIVSADDNGNWTVLVTISDRAGPSSSKRGQITIVEEYYS